MFLRYGRSKLVVVGLTLQGLLDCYIFVLNENIQGSYSHICVLDTTAMKYYPFEEKSIVNDPPWDIMFWTL